MIKDKLWKNSKPANEYPKDWLVIPVLDVIELLKEETKVKLNLKKGNTKIKRELNK
jgi:hypothetical protein